MNISAIAKDLVPLLGGSENIVSAAHCATRLRLVLADDSKVNKAAIDKLDGVKGCFSNAGQIQIIFGGCFHIKREHRTGNIGGELDLCFLAITD